MSYCRWSSDNGKCDVYAYQGDDGKYHIHVASSRVVGDVPKQDWSTPETLYDSCKAQAKFMETCVREPIGLKWDGMSFTEVTLTDLCNSLVTLKSAGYNVPQWAIDDVLDELEGLDDEVEE